MAIESEIRNGIWNRNVDTGIRDTGKERWTKNVARGRVLSLQRGFVAVGRGSLGGYTPGKPALRSVTLRSGGDDGVPTASRLAQQTWARDQSLQASPWVRTLKA